MSSDPWGVGPNGITYLGQDVPQPQTSAEYAFQLGVYAEKMVEIAGEVAAEIARKAEHSINKRVWEAFTRNTSTRSGAAK